jgi:hypothetical protein
MKKNSSVFLILGMFLLIFLIHISAYISASHFQKEYGFQNGAFSLTTMKGDQGITVDVTTYTAQIRDSWENGFSLFQKDPFIKENAGKTFPNGNLIYAAASVFYLFSSNPAIVYFISIFFSFLIAAFLLYRIVFLLYGNSRTTAIVFMISFCALYLTAFDSIFSLNNLFVNLKGDGGLIRNLGYIGRFPHIEFSLVFLIFWFYCWIKCFKNPTITNWLLLGFSLSILQYSYFYFWTGACFFTGMHLIFSSIRDRSLFRKIFWIFGSYIILTLPFWIKFLHFNHSDFAKEFTIRCRQIYTHKPQLFSNIFFFSAAVFCIDFLTCYLKERKFNFNLLIDTFRESKLQLCLFLTVYILLNIQVLAGFTIQNYHWEVAFFYPVFILLLIPYYPKVSALLSPVFRSRVRSTLAVSFILLFFTSTALLNNIRFGKLWASSLYLSQTEKELIDKIKKDVPSNSVLLSNSFSLTGIINANATVYTYFPYSFVSYCSNAELTYRLVSGFKMMGYSTQQIKDEMKKGEKWLNYLSDQTSGKIHHTNEPEAIPDNYNSLIYVYSATFYNNKSRNYSFSKALDEQIDSISNLSVAPPRAVDYIIIYKSILPAGYIKPALPNLIFENKDFELYKIKN